MFGQAHLLARVVAQPQWGGGKGRAETDMGRAGEGRRGNLLAPWMRAHTLQHKNTKTCTRIFMTGSPFHSTLTKITSQLSLRSSRKRPSARGVFTSWTLGPWWPFASMSGISLVFGLSSLRDCSSKSSRESTKCVHN